MDHRTEILDLRTALSVLRETPGQLIETNTEVDPAAELAGVYRYVGAGGTVMRPTKVDGPAMLFHNVKGHPNASVAIGVLASRERTANLFGCKKEELGHLVQSCAAAPIQPVVTDGPAPCQEAVHRAEDPDFNLFDLIPAPTNTPVDAGPYITLGMCYATHPDTGLSDVTIHRMCIQGRDELSIFLQPGSRHIGAMAERATELNQPLPISVSIGVDPAIEVLSCFEPPTTPLGFNELSISPSLIWTGTAISGRVWMRRFELTRRLFDAKITAQALQMDQEVHVSVFGGTRPHIGAVSVASPIGTIETTQFPGHKDGVVSGQWARTLSDAGYRPCVVAAGIHYDNLNSREIDMVVSLTQEMLNAILDMLSGTSECPEQK